MKNSKHEIYPFWLTLPALVVFSVFFMIPIIISFPLAFSEWYIHKIFEPKFNGLENFFIIFKDEVFGIAVYNTLLFAILTTIFKVIFGLLIALALVRASRINNFLRTVFYIPCILSPIVVGIIFTATFKMEGLVNQILQFVHIDFRPDWLGDYGTAMFCIILMEVWMWTGFTMAIFIAGLLGISNDYYEAATIDGATSFTKFKNITIPLLAPSFTVGITLNLIGSLKVFSQVYVLTNGGPGFATNVINTYVFNYYAKGFLGTSTAASLMLFIFITIISFLITKFLTSREVAA